MYGGASEDYQTGVPQVSIRYTTKSKSPSTLSKNIASSYMTGSNLIYHSQNKNKVHKLLKKDVKI